MAELRPWTCACGQRNAGPAPCSRCLSPAPADVASRPLADADADAGHARDARWRRVLAVVTAVLLVAGTVSMFTVGAEEGDADDATDVAAAEREGAQSLTVSPDQAPTGLTGIAGELAAELPGLMRFVAEARGLPFNRPVDVTLLPDEQFRDELLESAEPEEEDRQRTQTTQKVLVALGLLEKGVDLEEATESLLGDAVAGYYDTEEDKLVVRGARVTPSVRATLVHELVHALQDQHFDLDREDIEDRDDEASIGFTSVIEGDAVRIEELYSDSIPEEEQKLAELEEMEAAQGIDPTLPRIVFELIAFPYVAGPGFVRRVVDEGGQARLDAAFRDPPVTTEQILHPEIFLAGTPVRTVPPPAAVGEETDKGVLGQFGLLLVLQRLVDPERALRAARGWGADRYVAWEDGDRTCVRTSLVMDSATDASELRDALRRAADEHDDLELATGGDAITFTACG